MKILFKLIRFNRFELFWFDYALRGIGKPKYEKRMKINLFYLINHTVKDYLFNLCSCFGGVIKC